MTHGDAIEGNRLGMQPPPSTAPGESVCQGHLVMIDAFSDRDLHRGQIRQRTITVYRCEACDHRVVLGRRDHVELPDPPSGFGFGDKHVSTDLEYELVNSYPVNLAHGLVKGLAEVFALPHER